MEPLVLKEYGKIEIGIATVKPLHPFFKLG